MRLTQPIYLDYMASTPVDPRVADIMAHYLTKEGVYANPASSHKLGKEARACVEKARVQVANLIHAKPEEIIWTSGATEADNLAIKGAARFYQRKGRHIVTCVTEHKAVIDTCYQLQRDGFDVTFLPVQKNGLIDLAQLEASLRPDTILVSIMYVNNEIGVIQDIPAIGKMTRARGILFHVDAAQAVGKFPINVVDSKIDLMSLTAHKLYGPKGIGALYVCREPRVRLEALMHGGGHEQGIRSGTLATHQIMGMGEAYRLAKEEGEQDDQHVRHLRDIFWGIVSALPGIHLNGDAKQRIPNNLNFSVAGVDGEALLFALRDLAISTSSACSSASMDPSHVLVALGLQGPLAYSALRVSFGRFSTESEVRQAAELVCEQVTRLRNLAPKE